MAPNRSIELSGGSRLAESLRATVAALRASGGDELSDVIEQGAEAVALIDDFAQAVDSDRRGGELTEAGIMARRARHAERLQLFAEKLIKRAREIEKQAEESVDAAWARLSTPARDIVEHLRIADLQRRLEREDALIRQQQLLLVARNGSDDLLLRAALTMPHPPMDIEGANWRPMLDAGTLASLRQALAERLGPQGADSWRARELRSIALALRAAAGEGTPTTGIDPIAEMARQGQ